MKDKVVEVMYDVFKRDMGTNFDLSKLSSKKSADGDIDVVLDEVMWGHWGNGRLRTFLLTIAGWDPKVVQAEVNIILKGRE